MRQIVLALVCSCLACGVGAQEERKPAAKSRHAAKARPAAKAQEQEGNAGGAQEAGGNLPGTKPASGGNVPGTKLGEAMRVEALEPQRAVGLYEKVAQDETVEAGERAEAWLRLGKLLRRLGREEEGRVALQKAAGTKSEAGARARGLLAEVPLDRARRAQIEELIATLQQPQQAQQRNGNELWNVLVGCGEPAVPLLVEAIQAEKGWTSFVHGAVIEIGRIGGEAGAAALAELARSPDPRLRSVVMQAAVPQIPQVEIASALVERLLQSKAGDLRQEAVRNLWRWMTTAQLIGAAGDGDASVRDAAFDVLAGSWQQISPRFSKEDLMRLLPHVERAVEQPASADAQSAFRFLCPGPLLELAAGRALWLRTIALPGFDPGGRLPQALPFVTPNEHAQAVLETAKQIGAVPLSGPTTRHKALTHFLQAVIACWDEQSFGVVLDLIRLGYAKTLQPEVVEQWLVKNGKPSMVAPLSGLLDQCANPDQVLGWIATQALGEDLIEPMQRWLARAHSEREPQRAWSHVRAACAVLARIGSTAAVQDVVALAEKDKAMQSAAVWGLGRGESDAARAALRRLFAESAAITPEVRNEIFAHYVRSGARDALELYARAYALGLGKGPRRGLQWFGKVDENVQGVTRRVMQHGYAADDEARIFAACLRDGGAQAWDDAFACNIAELPDAVLGVLARCAKDAPQSMQEKLLGVWAVCRERIPPSAAPDLVAAIAPFLERDAPELVVEALRAVPGTFGAGSLPAALEHDLPLLLQSPHGEVRAIAASAVARCGFADAAKRIAPLLQDPWVEVRRTAAAQLVRLLDRSVVPALLEAMKDEDEQVRRRAQEALVATEIYWRHKEQPDVSKAAAELVELASPGNSKDVRLAAVASLGSLGAPQTLPALIRNLQDPDEEIAAAARAALERINAPRR